MATFLLAGVRVSELCALTLDTLYLESRPAYLEVRGSIHNPRPAAKATRSTKFAPTPTSNDNSRQVSNTPAAESEPPRAEIRRRV